MSSARRTLTALAALLPLGALGISSALAKAPTEPVASVTGSGAEQPGVAERLAAIRLAVSQVTADQAGLQLGDPAIEKAWWGNGPYGGGVWGNGGGWKNWGNGWHNGGWRNAWANGGWNNWHNNWHNGGWKNYWRNW